MISPLLRRTISKAAAIAVALVVWTAAVGYAQHRMVEMPLTSRLLDAAQASQNYILEQQEHWLQQHSKTLAATTSFASYIAQSLGAAQTSGKVADTVSIRDLLEDRRAELGFDSAAIVDQTKRVIATTGDGITNDQDLSNDPRVVAMGKTASQTSGFLLDRQRILFVTFTPILQQTDTDATLMTATRIDAAFLKNIAAISRSDVALVASSGSGPLLSLSSLQGGDAAELQTAIAAQPERLLEARSGDVAARTVPLTLGGDHWTARLSALPESGDKLFLFSLVSPKAGAEITYALAWPLIAGLGVLMLALIFVTATLWKRLLLPITALTELSERVLAGDYDMEYRRPETGTIGQLGLLFNYLLNDLRRHRPQPGGPRRRITDRK